MATMDIDLLVDPSPENALRLKKALSVLKDNQIANLELDDIKKLIPWSVLLTKLSLT